MSASKAQQKAVNKYMKENYDEIKVRVKKGCKAEIKVHANAYGESINSFINRAIDETIKRDNLKVSVSAPLLPDVSINELNQSAFEMESEERWEKKEKHYRVFTEEDAKCINLSELLSNIKYQVNIADIYGMEVLSSLIEKARQQTAEVAISDE